MCHPGEPNADFRRANVYDRDLEAGYHEKRACTEAHEDGCTVYDLFGGFGDNPGKLLQRPVTFSHIHRNVDVLSGEAEAHYRQLSTQVRSRNDEDGGKPLRQTDRDILGNVEGTWKLTLREVKPEFVGLLVEAIEFLNAHSAEFAFQLGGARNFGAGDADVWFINPLCTEREVRRVFNRAQSTTRAMETDGQWTDEVRPAFVGAFHVRVAARDPECDAGIPDADTIDGSRGDDA